MMVQESRETRHRVTRHRAATAPETAPPCQFRKPKTRTSSSSHWISKRRAHYWRCLPPPKCPDSCPIDTGIYSNPAPTSTLSVGRKRLASEQPWHSQLRVTHLTLRPRPNSTQLTSLLVSLRTSPILAGAKRPRCPRPSHNVDSTCHIGPLLLLSRPPAPRFLPPASCVAVL